MLQYFADKLIRDALSRICCGTLCALSLLSVFGLSDAAAQPIISSSHSVTRVIDANTDGASNPGDTLEYTVRLTNSGTQDVNSLSVAVGLDANTKLVPGSFNVQPLAVNDADTVAEDGNQTTLTGNLLLNDAGRDIGETFEVQSVGTNTTPGTISGSSGTLSWLRDGSYTYTLDNSLVNSLDTGDTRLETFTYTVTDTAGPSDSASLEISITGTNDAPTAVADTISETEDSSVASASINLLSNDDGGGDAGETLSVIALGNLTSPGDSIGSFGTLSWLSDGTASYVLDNTNTTVNALSDGETQVDVFTYSMSDGEASASSTVTVSITGANDAPIAVDDSYSAFQNFRIQVDAANGLLQNDSDPESQTITAVAIDVQSAAAASVTINADGSFSYDPNPNFRGTDTFTYTVVDTLGAQSTGTASLDVSSNVIFVNNAVAANGNGSVVSPYNNLSDAVLAHNAGDTIFIYEGTGMSGGLDASYSLASTSVSIVGEGVGLSLNNVLQIPSGNAPNLGNDSVTFDIVNSNVSISGVNIDGQGTGTPVNALYNAAASYTLSLTSVSLSTVANGIFADVSGDAMLTHTMSSVGVSNNNFAAFDIGTASNAQYTANFSNVSVSTFGVGTAFYFFGSGASTLSANLESTQVLRSFQTAIAAEAFGSANITLNLNGGNNVQNAQIGISLEEDVASTSSIVANITAANGTANTITNNGTGIRNSGGLATVNVNPITQVIGNGTNFDNS